MENTQHLHFPNDSAQWILSTGGGRWSGPFTGADLLKDLEAGKIEWTSFISKRGSKVFHRISEVPEFQSFLPGAPSMKEIETIVHQAEEIIHAQESPPPGPPVTPPTSWFLYKDQAQYGPFPENEVKRLVSIQHATSSTYAWREGMDTWLRLDETKEFKSIFSSSPREAIQSKGAPVPPKDKRSSPRRPLIARVLVTDHKKVSSGICRDISVGGMQVLTDSVPGKVGDRVRLNVSQSGEGALQPFVAEGEIVRVLEDGRGFSFRFVSIDDPVRNWIEKFIRT